MRFGARVVLLLLAVSGSASADGVTALGLTGGVVRHAADDELGFMGFEAAYGRRVGPVTLMGQYALLAAFGATPDGSANNGAMHRIGVMVRYKAAGLLVDDGGFGLWLEGGLGREYRSLASGPNDARSDVLLGVGLQIRPKTKASAWLGIRMVLTELAGGAPGETCAGPCDVATRPARYGTGFMMVLGATWGS